jgi:hypothetical protein
MKKWQQNVFISKWRNEKARAGKLHGAGLLEPALAFQKKRPGRTALHDFRYNSGF